MELDIWDDFLTIQFDEDDEVFPKMKAHVRGECIHKGFLMYGKSMRWIEPEEKEVCDTEKKQLYQCIEDEGEKQGWEIEMWI